MSIRSILHAPNKILSAPGKMVSRPLSSEIEGLIADMKDTVIASNGIGLAAPQIGASLRVIVINFEKEPYAIINPEIKWSSNGTSALEEGCLSVPDYFVKISRPKKIIITGMNEKGETIEIKAKDMLAKIFQHEIDHTNGILISNYQENRILF
ncbi:MAG: peptide deformylase [bacterium]|nr:peptide deformylase [bacterium]